MEHGSGEVYYPLGNTDEHVDIEASVRCSFYSPFPNFLASIFDLYSHLVFFDLIWTVIFSMLIICSMDDMGMDQPYLKSHRITKDPRQFLANLQIQKQNGEYEGDFYFSVCISFFFLIL